MSDVREAGKKRKGVVLLLIVLCAQPVDQSVSQSLGWLSFSIPLSAINKTEEEEEKGRCVDISSGSQAVGQSLCWLSTFGGQS